jgi:hypothetical protein
VADPSAPLLRDKARQQGIAAVAIRDSHHFAALWPDIEPFADQGFIVLAMVNGRQGASVWGGTRKVLGNNPMAFACPRPGHKPSSRRSPRAASSGFRPSAAMPDASIRCAMASSCPTAAWRPCNGCSPDLPNGGSQRKT